MAYVDDRFARHQAVTQFTTIKQPMITTEEPLSLWERTSPEVDLAQQGPRLDAVDVAIVGGGYTGLSTALHCAENGLSVQVLEANCIGFGGSGRNVGFVNAAAWLPPARVRKKLGETYGPRFVERFSRAPAEVFDLIEKHQIQCEVTRTGTIHAAHSRSGMKDLTARHAEWQRLGQPVDLLNPKETKEMTGSERFHGGLLDHRAGTINPMGYCRGLARAARGAGAEISIGTRVTNLSKIGTGWRVETDQSAVTAKTVVLGTNAYTDALWPRLQGVFTPIHYMQAATVPLGEKADAILPGRQGLWDTGTVIRSYRKDAAGRLLIGTMGRAIGTEKRGLTRRWAQQQISHAFPALGPVEIETVWDGKIAMTPDHLPRIHQLEDGLWTPIGYNGRGITTGTVFGKSMAALLTGADPADLPLPLTQLKRVPNNGFKTAFFDLALTATQAWRSR